MRVITGAPESSVPWMQRQLQVVHFSRLFSLCSLFFCLFVFIFGISSPLSLF
jgi:hypothetical protein